MIYKYTGIKEIIAKVMADMNLQDDTHRIEEWKEWAFEAMAFLYSEPILQPNVEILPVENYQAKSPCDFYSLIQIAFGSSATGPFSRMKKMTGSFDSVKNRTGKDYMNFDIDREYRIDRGFIRTNFKEGFIAIAYNSIPVDEEGLPLIPDHISFKEAMYWYILTKLFFPKYMSGEIDINRYSMLKNNWSKFCNQAHGVALMPDRDELATIYDMWIRLVPDVHAHKSFFDVMGEQEYVKKKY